MWTVHIVIITCAVILGTEVLFVIIIIIIVIVII